jgi:hypothetical protein
MAFFQSGIFRLFCGDTDDTDVIANVTYDDRTGTDRHGPADPLALKHACAASDVAVVTDGDITGQHGAGGDVDKIAKCTVVVDPRTGIDDGPPADPAPGLNDGTGHDLRTLADFHVTADHG